ncbi:helix-turn-helix domain-containing protein [Pyxidicoccus sp. 3LG]
MPVEEVARRLGCARTQVFKLLHQGQLKRGRSVGRRTMISVASLDALQTGESQRQPRSRTAKPRRALAQAQALAAAIRDLPLLPSTPLPSSPGR